jgi:hypothetical protein
MVESKEEPKFFPGNAIALAVTTAGVLGSMMTVATGTSDSTRIGDLIFPKWVEFMYSIEVGTAGVIAAADQFNTVRVILFIWNESDGLTAPTAAILLDAATGGVTTDMIVNHDDPQLFRVIYDRQHVVHNTPLWNGAAVQWNHGVDAHFALDAPLRIPLKHPVEFDSATTYGSHKLYYLVCSDSAFAPNPTIDLGWQVCFTDS